MKDSEILDAAAREIEKGWARGVLGAWTQQEGPVCAAGALRRVLIQDTGAWTEAAFVTVEQLARQVVRIADEAYPRRSASWLFIESFNDARERTVDEVVAVFEKARAKAEEEGR